MMDVVAVYDRFFALGGMPPTDYRPWQYRRKETSMRLPGCALLASLVRDRRPSRVLDLGSGLTTLVLRELQRQEFPQMIVVTVDTSERWLQTTQTELQRDGLNDEHCYTHAEFDALQWEPFDLISVDEGNLEHRVTIVDALARWCAPRGLLVLDDWKMRDYAQRMTVALTDLGFTVTERYDTMDEFDQFLALAERAS